MDCAQTESDADLLIGTVHMSNHLSSLVQGISRSSGYLKKIRPWKTLLGAVLYIDLLKPIQMLTLSLESDHVNVASGIQCLLLSY